ncbi:MAG: insulinase family protein [Rikenellaceae bacterium]
MKRILTLILCIVAAQSFAAEQTTATIANDPALRRGKLPNELTYYIRHNAKPKGQADFYIVSDVGAIQESDDQQGLAHFIEHMAFNGTRDLPGKMAIDYLESIGVKFGANLNAYTSWDNTVYMMKDLPTARESAVDTALLILQNWAAFIEPHKEEIDKERGVIKEELRTRDGAAWRSTMTLIEALGRDTKYEERNLIGTLEGLDSFEAESLTSFYHTWYRPEHQAIIIVGDIEVDHVEERVKELFGEIPSSPADAPQKDVIYTVDNSEPIIEIFTDPEQTYTEIQYIMKRRAREKSENATITTEREILTENLISLMQQERLNEVAKMVDSPILRGYMYFGGIGIIPTLTTTSYYVYCDEDESEAALQEIVTQMERVRRYGFGNSELLRAKQNMLSGIERSYANRDDQKNNSYVTRYIDNFRFGVAIPSAEEEYLIDNRLLEDITLDEINAAIEALYPTDNQVVMLSIPQKETLTPPTEERIAEIIETTLSSEIEPLKREEQIRELISDDTTLEGSEIVAESYNSEYDTTEWILSNGVTVVVKPTSYKADEVIMQGVSRGGRSLLPDSLYQVGGFVSRVLSQSGVGEFSDIELDRALAGKIAYVTTNISDYTQSIGGSCSPNDIETMMELLYLRFCTPRYSEDDFEVVRRYYRAILKNQESNPDYLHYKRYNEVAFDNHLRSRQLTEEVLDSFSLEQIESVQERLFSDADNFTFYIVGSVELESLKPLVEKYIGSLPTTADDKKMEYIDDKIRYANGRIREEITVPMEQPKVSVATLLSGSSLKYELRNIVTGKFFESALNDLLLNTVREEMGGTYGARGSLSINKTPYRNFTLEISYDTNDELFDEMQKCVLEQLDIIATEGATEAQMTKCREYLLKSFANSQEQNGSWMGWISRLRVDKINYLSDYEAVVRSITSKDVQRMARKILSEKRCIEVIMHPSK